jgi:hypothetical protein
MKTNHPPIVFRDRNLGLVLLVASQLLVGIVHVIFGFWLLSASSITAQEATIFGAPVPDIYSFYTIVFSALTLLFAIPLWQQKRWGWIGTFGILAFVIVADSLTLLNLPSVPGIPKFAGYGEITYSIIVMFYLLQNHIRKKFKITF